MAVHFMTSSSFEHIPSPSFATGRLKPQGFSVCQKVVKAALFSLPALLLAACGGGDAGGGDAGTAVSDTARISAASSKGEQPGPTGAPTNATSVSATTIVVRAGSTQLGGVGALLLLRYNGVVIGNAEARTATVGDIVFKVSTAIDGGVLDVAFTNAELATGGAARQLTLDSVVINGTPFSSTGPGVLYDLGWGADAFDWLNWVGGSRVVVANGAYRIPLLPASMLGSLSPIDASQLSPEPGAYVDVVAGTDAGPGTMDRPYKTLSALAKRKFFAGEQIHLRCGSVWRETLALSANQLIDGIQIAPYGSDCATAGRPTILGADTFNGGWTQNGTVWSRSLPANTPKINQVRINGGMLRTARWPNAGDAPARVRTTSAPEPWRFWMSDADANTLAGRDLNGATVMLRTQAWMIESQAVKASGATWGEITLLGSPRFNPQPGAAWTMQDKLWMLDSPGEFFHDVVAQKLYLIAPNASLDLNTANVEGSVRDLAVDLRDRAWIQVRGLAVGMARLDGLRTTDAPQIRVNDIQSSQNGSAGIRLWQWRALPDGSAGPHVLASVVSQNGEFGIDATYVEAANITGNTVLDTGAVGFSGPVTASIAVGPAGHVVGNDINGSGYHGIYYAGKQGTVVANNELRNYCSRLSDCAAIYTWNSAPSASPEIVTFVDSNRIFAPHPSASKAREGEDVVAGIYVDDYSRHVIVRNNFLQGMPVGVLLHNASTTTVENNTVWLASRAAIAVSMDHFDRDWSVGNVIRNNTIVPMTTASATWPKAPTFDISHPVWFEHVLSGAAALTAGRNEFSSNRVVQVFGTQPHHARINGPAGLSHATAAEWASLNAGERLPEEPMTFSPYIASLGPELVNGGQFSAGLAPWNKHWNWQITGYDAQVVSGPAGCSGPCARMTSADFGDMIFSPAFTMRAGVPHAYRWTAVAGATGFTMGRPYISRAGTPWDDMNDATGFMTLNKLVVPAGQTRQYEAFFVPKWSAPAQVNLQLATLGVPAFMDSVSVREVSGWTFAAPADWAVPVVASRTAALTISQCGDVGLAAGCQLTDTSGNAVALPFSVPAGSQQMLLRANSSYRR